MSPPIAGPADSRAFRVTASLFALAALALVLALGWLRFLVPARRPVRVRDVTPRPRPPTGR